jgi:hypothetical protein
MVYPFSTGNSDGKPALFIYETENNDEDGKYTAYHRDRDRQDYWNNWLDNRYLFLLNLPTDLAIAPLMLVHLRVKNTSKNC